MRLACNLREARGRRRLTELAQASGVHHGTLSQLERGRLLLPDDKVEPVAEAYGLPAHEWYPPQVALVVTYPEPNEDRWPR